VPGRVSKTYLMRMAVQRSGWLVALASVLLGPMAFAADADVARAGQDRTPERPPVLLGVMADAGVPDGANVALALRPARWLRVHAGAGHNTVSNGYRGGMAFLPLGEGPSFSLEAGHYRDGDANGFVRRLVGSNGALTPIFHRIGYNYANAQLGLDLGKRSFQFYVHGGVSYLRGVLHDVQAALDTAGVTDPKATTTVRIVQDPIVHAWVPSLKVGAVMYFGGGP
jgi:hypothetical protein